MTNRYLFRSVFFTLSLFMLSACEKNKMKEALAEENLQLEYLGPQVERDLAQIKADGVLRAISIYNSTSYFLYRGQPMGFEYELLVQLAKHLDLELEMVVARNINELFDLLNSGKGDVIAFGLTVTEARKQIVSFTNHHYATHQSLVQRKPERWRQMPGYKLDQYLTTDVLDLIGDTIHVPYRSSYYERLKNLQGEIGGEIYLDTNVGKANTDDLIRMVVEGKIKYTAADHNIAAINQCYFPELDIDTPLSLSQRIAWAVRKNSPQLLAAMNGWVDKMRGEDLFYLLYNKYFKNEKSYQRRVNSDFYSRESGKISPFDSLIQQNAEKLNWDWRLLASQIYQESRFDVEASSWAGARGLMQLMPATARQLGLGDPYNPQENLAAGTRYLQMLNHSFEEIPDSVQRIKFVLAAYNCGLGHVRDAQRLAEAMGKNPMVWDGQVEIYLRKLALSKYHRHPVVRYGYVRGEEPYAYVRDIFLRYAHYRQLLPLDSSRFFAGVEPF